MRSAHRKRALLPSDGEPRAQRDQHVGDTHKHQWDREQAEDADSLDPIAHAEHAIAVRRHGTMMIYAKRFEIRGTARATPADSRVRCFRGGGLLG